MIRYRIEHSMRTYLEVLDMLLEQLDLCVASEVVEGEGGGGSSRNNRSAFWWRRSAARTSWWNLSGLKSLLVKVFWKKKLDRWGCAREVVSEIGCGKVGNESLQGREKPNGRFRGSN